MKRAQSSSSSSSSDLFSPPKRRAVTTKTVDKWIVEHDRTLNTSTWLEYDQADRYHVASLRCKVCVLFEDKLTGFRNFNRAFIDGSTNLRTSSFVDHGKSDMHNRAMLLLKKGVSKDVCEYAPIAKSFFPDG